MTRLENTSRRCAQCKNRLIQKNDDGVTFRIEGPVSVDDNGICHARCWWCKSNVSIPLELSKSFAMETVEVERVVVLTRAPNKSSLPK